MAFIGIVIVVALVLHTIRLEVARARDLRAAEQYWAGRE